MAAQKKARINQWRRLLWHINRSPLKMLVKEAMRLRYYNLVCERKKLAASLPMDARLSELGQALNRDGYVVMNDAVPTEMLTLISGAGEAKLARAAEAAQQQLSGHKSFWTRLLDEDMQNGALPVENPFVQFALQPAVISVLTKALGELPRLDYVLLTLSKGNGADYSYSQLWHRDHDDVRTIKLFVYLTDVENGDDGPFTFLPGPVSDRFGFSRRSHRPDEAIFRLASPAEVKAMVAPRLTTFIVETSRCMHMGSRLSVGHSRLLYTATYITVPRMYPEPPSQFKLSGKESVIDRHVLIAA